MTTTPNNAGSATVINLAALEQLALAATPGPWMRLFGERTVYDRMEDGCRGNAIARADLAFSSQDANNLDFIAAANPATVLALIALARATPQHPEDLSNAEFLSKRLARVAKLAGVTMPSGTHEQIAEVAGTILGDIARHLEKAATPQHSVTEQAKCPYCGGAGGKCDAAFPHPRAQPLASTAATQPEQASERDLFERTIPMPEGVQRGVGLGEDNLYTSRYNSLEAQEYNDKWKGWQVRAALAIPASTAASEQADDLAWHKEALAAVNGKLESVWEGIREAIQKYSGAPCEGEPFDRLDELLSRLTTDVASEQQAGADERERKLEEAASRCVAANVEFEAWALKHGGLPLDKAGDALSTDDGLALPTYKFGRTEIAWRAYASAALTHRATTATPVPASRDLLVDLYEFTKYAACSQRENTAEFIDGLFEQIEKLQPRCAAQLAAAPDIATTAADRKAEFLDGMRSTADIVATWPAWKQTMDAPTCTCPSGDGSLRWPCPAHPPESVTAADQQGDTASASRADSELHFNATRLRNVARLVGLESAVPKDDATLDGARGSVLGMISGALRNALAQQGSAQAQAGETSDAVASEEWSYSTDEEHYHDAEPSRIAIIRHALAEVDAQEDGASGFWIGRNVRFVGQIDASWIIEQLQEQAHDECGEWAETYLEDVTKAEEAELESLVNAWAARVDRPNFWTVKDTEFIAIEQAREIDRAAMAAPAASSGSDA